MLVHPSAGVSGVRVSAVCGADSVGSCEVLRKVLGKTRNKWENSLCVCHVCTEVPPVSAPQSPLRSRSAQEQKK